MLRSMTAFLFCGRRGVSVGPRELADTVLPEAKHPMAPATQAPLALVFQPGRLTPRRDFI